LPLIENGFGVVKYKAVLISIIRLFH